MVAAEADKNDVLLALIDAWTVTSAADEASVFVAPAAAAAGCSTIMLADAEAGSDFWPPARPGHADRTEPSLTTRLPTLIPLPDELRSPRLVLRPFRPADAEQVFAAVEESRVHLRPWMAWVDGHVSVDNSHDWCARCAANWLLRAELTVGLFAAASGRYLGCVSLHDPDWDLRAFRIGYWLRASAVGQGYATEAVRLLVELAVGPLAARRVELRCDARNGPSRRVAERVGFVLEGQLRNAFLDPDGQPADELVFALIPADARLRPA